jgi:hypothetical protein
MKTDKRADRRGTNPRSLANLKPNLGGEVRNPNGHNGPRPYTEAIRSVSVEPLPELVRVAMNARFRREVRRVLQRACEIPDFYERGITWAEANARRLNLAAAFHGNIAASVEVREAVEGRAPTRVEFASKNDKLEELLECFRKAAAEAEPSPDDGPKIVQ